MGSVLSPRARFLVSSLLIVATAVVAGLAHASSTVIAAAVGGTFVLAALIALIIHRRERRTKAPSPLSVRDRRRIAAVNGAVAALQIAWGPNRGILALRLGRG